MKIKVAPGLSQDLDTDMEDNIEQLIEKYDDLRHNYDVLEDEYEDLQEENERLKDLVFDMDKQLKLFKYAQEKFLSNEDMAMIISFYRIENSVNDESA